MAQPDTTATYRRVDVSIDRHTGDAASPVSSGPGGLRVRFGAEEPEVKRPVKVLFPRS